jgi:hypothetical protein
MNCQSLTRVKFLGLFLLSFLVLSLVGCNTAENAEIQLLWEEYDRIDAEIDGLPDVEDKADADNYMRLTTDRHEILVRIVAIDSDAKWPNRYRGSAGKAVKDVLEFWPK